MSCVQSWSNSRKCYSTIYKRIIRRSQVTLLASFIVVQVQINCRTKNTEDIPERPSGQRPAAAPQRTGDFMGGNVSNMSSTLGSTFFSSYFLFLTLDLLHFTSLLSLPYTERFVPQRLQHSLRWNHFLRWIRFLPILIWTAICKCYQCS